MNKSIRQIHRWVSIAFTLLVIANFVAMGQEESTRQVVGFLTLIPLVFLLLTGMYLFVLPYAARRRGGRTTDGTESDPGAA